MPCLASAVTAWSDWIKIGKRTLSYSNISVRPLFCLLFFAPPIPVFLLQVRGLETLVPKNHFVCEVGPFLRACHIYMYVYYIPPPLTVHFPVTRSVRYQPILHTLYYTLHTEHAYWFSYHFLNNIVITTVIEMVEMVEILNGRLGKCSVERVRYVINNLLHLVIVKCGVISLVLCISTRLRLVTILLLLMKYLVMLHAVVVN